jgi:hypothetical protein
MAGTSSIRSDGVVCSGVPGLGRTPVVYSSDLKWKEKWCSIIAYHFSHKSYIIISGDDHNPRSQPPKSNYPRISVSLAQYTGVPSVST